MQNKNCTLGRMARTLYHQNEVRSRPVLVFLSAARCFPIYPTTSIMTVFQQRSRPWDVLSVVWTRLWPDVQDIYFGLEPFPTERCGEPFWKTSGSDFFKTPQICSWLGVVCVLFSKHDLENLRKTRSDHTPADVSGLQQLNFFREKSCSTCTVIFYDFWPHCTWMNEQYHNLTPSNLRLW